MVFRRLIDWARASKPPSPAKEAAQILLSSEAVRERFVAAAGHPSIPAAAELRLPAEPATPTEPAVRHEPAVRREPSIRLES